MAVSPNDDWMDWTSALLTAAGLSLAVNSIEMLYPNLTFWPPPSPEKAGGPPAAPAPPNPSAEPAAPIACCNRPGCAAGGAYSAMRQPLTGESIEANVSSSTSSVFGSWVESTDQPAMLTL